MKELEDTKHKHSLEMIKAKNESLALEHDLKSQRLDKLIMYASRGGDLRMLNDS